MKKFDVKVDFGGTLDDKVAVPCETAEEAAALVKKSVESLLFRALDGHNMGINVDVTATLVP